MTHKNIYDKFMIEYDKADITSSYPSLTEYEVATLLDKAYLALIAQKITGNNPRSAGFEADVKSIEDIRPLVTRTKLEKYYESTTMPTIVKVAKNEDIYSIPSDYLYYVQSDIEGVPMLLVSHEDSVNFKASKINKPWIKNPVIYIEENRFHILHDDQYDFASTKPLLIYVKTPIKFLLTEDPKIDDVPDQFKPTLPDGTVITLPSTTDTQVKFDDTVFECSDSMAEELINLAIIMASEIVESQRLNSKLNTRPLES